MNAEIIHRKGARKVQDIPEEVLQGLHAGKIETVNLTEWLAIDHGQLIAANFPDLGVSENHLARITAHVRAQKKPTAMNSVRLVGAALYQRLGTEEDFPALGERFRNHRSDSIRCYACYLIGLDDRLTLEEKLARAEPLIADHHFGVREVVWMALRPSLEDELERSIRLLRTWTAHPDANVRRFVTEATRPRGVWCRHIDQLKEQPELALPLLEPLKSDPSTYVQDSVGNWLNDASKSRPDFVLTVCEAWQKASPTKETARILKRARRTLDK